MPEQSAGQGPVPRPPPPRAQYVFHVYVDPIFGDDVRASAQNPGVPGAPQPLSRHPSNDTSMGNNGIGGILQHAPYSFRTLTGPLGVQAYLDQVTAQFGTQVGTAWQLPWQFTVGGVQKSVEWVIIHCAPGIYAAQVPTDSSPVPIDARNGLVFNGEYWPFKLKHRVSIQGTSALDTIFDARRQSTAVLVVDRSSVPDNVATHDGSFIDGITVRGARSDGEPMGTTNASGAGILLDRLGNTQVCISNCFLIDNSVGLAVDTGQFSTTAHQPRILNNTFARNVIALWNGSREPLEQNRGRGELTLLNNVFDSWLPGVAPPFVSAPFAGVAAEDLLVTTVFTNVTIVTLTPALSFCAWEAGRPPVGLSNWQIPAPRTPTPLPAPKVDLTHWTGTVPGTFRGILFVNDTLRAAAVGGAGVDYSPHDFRLAPNVAEAASQPPTSAGKLNPLVNQGLTLADPAPTAPHHIQQINMANGLWMSWIFGRRPGLSTPNLPAPAEDLASLHAWDFDAEGMGNQRIGTRTGFPVPVLPNNPIDPLPLTIDLGADEMGELIIAGFIDGTRILTHTVPNAAGVIDHTRLFFFNLFAPGNSYPRPVANRIVGRTVTWYGHVQQNSGGDNYTAGSGKRKQIVDGLDPNFATRPRFMRNLECDTSPLLFPDPHPAWGLAWESSGLGVDPHGSMPWWTGPATSVADNAYAYYNPSPGYPLHLQNVTTLFFGVTTTQVLLGVLNPPGSALTGTPSFLSGMYATSTLGPWAPCGGGATYSVNTWGFGATAPGCPDIVPVPTDPAEHWRGVRHNAQLLGGSPDNDNLQTLLVINGLPPVDESLDPGAENPAATANHQRDVERARLRVRGR